MSQPSSTKNAATAQQAVIEPLLDVSSRPPAAVTRSASVAHSIQYATHGFAAVWTTQRNFKIHSVMAMVAVALGVVSQNSAVGFSPLQWAVLALAIGAMFACELLNTALEWTCDWLAQGRRLPQVKQIKDAAAAACLAMAVASVAIGFCLFWPLLSLWIQLLRI